MNCLYSHIVIHFLLHHSRLQHTRFQTFLHIYVYTCIYLPVIENRLENKIQFSFFFVLKETIHLEWDVTQCLSTIHVVTTTKTYFGQSLYM